MLAILLLSPMASFEQEGRMRDTRRQTVAVHRLKIVQSRSSTCCDPAMTAGEAAQPTDQGMVTLPNALSLEKADREMMRNHARSSESILPTLAIPLVEEADADMDLMFQLSNASWMSDHSAADREIDQRFRIENLFPLASGTISAADKEMNARFLSETGHS